MTMKLKVDRYHIRPVSAQASLPPRDVSLAQATAAQPPVRPAEVKPRATIPDDAFQPDPAEDGFGNQAFVPPRAEASTSGTPGAETQAGAEIDAIRREGLTGRQLRMARRMAQKHNLPATSDFDAVRLLRKAGIDPFGHSAVLELVQGTGQPGSTALTLAPSQPPLPKTMPPPPLPSTEKRVEESHLAEVRRIQSDLVARRRRRYLALWARLAVFVLLPTILAGWYFFAVATPMYTATSKFVIQQSSTTASLAGIFSGTALATTPDSVAVQNYLQSNDAMQRLDQDLGFRAHFQDPNIDPIQRLEPDASNSATYALYSKYIRVAFDPTEGLISMEVSAASPETAVAFSNALIGYAEERVDALSAPVRRAQEESARAAFEDATQKLTEAQARLVELQTQTRTFSSEVEAGLVTSQIGALETQLMQERLALAQMESNASPNQARMEPVKARIATLETEIASLRSGMIEAQGDGPSLASVQAELAMATAEVATRQMMLAQATTAMETSRIEAQRQTRYLELAVRPVTPDRPSYPKAFEDTLVVMLIFLGIYLMVSMTIAILREQLSG